jgi:protein-disulfide isomerase
LKKYLLLSILLALPLSAAEDPTLPYMQEFFPYCEENPVVEQVDYPQPVGEGLSADLLGLRSSDPNCGGRYLRVVKGDRIWVGQPWILSSYDGTIPEKIKKFAWERLRDTASATVSDRMTPEGLRETEVEITTDWGRIRIPGVSDPAGNAFYPGRFVPISEGARKPRLERMSSIFEGSPQKGRPGAAVELVEFSDFQCPSCRYADRWMAKLLEKYDGQIVYRRVDFPLMASHPWAFPAALYGRAIWQQSPEAFWRYKSEVYENQASLNSFTIEDFAHGFVQANELDLARFETAIASQALREEILGGVAAGRIAEVSGTPTFWINGQPVSAGEGGRHLDKVLAVAIEQKR